MKAVIANESFARSVAIQFITTIFLAYFFEFYLLDYHATRLRYRFSETPRLMTECVKIWLKPQKNLAQNQYFTLTTLSLYARIRLFFFAIYSFCLKNLAEMSTSTHPARFTSPCQHLRTRLT